MVSFPPLRKRRWLLALRARGIGSALTTDHLFFADEAAHLLGIPENVTQVALLPVAYFTGTGFKPARRLPAGDRTHWNAWGARGAMSALAAQHRVAAWGRIQVATPSGAWHTASMWCPSGSMTNAP